MSARSAAYKTYVIFTLVALVGLSWWVMRVRKALPEDEKHLDASPAKHVPAPEFERFPYQRGGNVVLSVARRREVTGDVPTLWLRGNGVLVRKKNEGDDSLEFERTVIPKKSIEQVLTRLLDNADERDEAGDVVVTLTGTKEVRTFRRATTAELTEKLGDVLADVTWKPAKLRRIRLTATEAGPEDAEKWPVSRLPMRKIVAEGSMVSTTPDVNAVIQKRVRLAGLYRHEDGSFLVTAVPSLDE